MKIWIFLLIPFLSLAQVIPSTLQKKVQEANSLHDPLFIAEQFYGLPYASHALSKENPEKFVVDFDR